MLEAAADHKASFYLYNGPNGYISSPDNLPLPRPVKFLDTSSLESFRPFPFTKGAFEEFSSF